MNRKSISLMIFGCCVLAALTSCRKEDETPNVATTESVALTQNEIFEKEFRRFVVSEKMSVRDTEFGINKLCNKINNSVDSKEAVRLFDKLGEMAINQYVSETNYYCRQNWYLQLWYVTLNAFVFAQHYRQDSFEDWDRLFKFFNRYTDEISEVEKHMPPPDGHGFRWCTKRGGYLLGLKGDLGTCVRVMRRFYFPSISNGLTEEQKADIMRRLDEVDKFAAFPPDSPCYEKEK